MKHGDQAKAKAQASGSKSAVEGAEDSKRSVKRAAGSKAAGKSAKAGSKTGEDESGSKGSRAGAKSSGKGRVAVVEQDVTFTNPAVGAAFERAIQTYPNAFRRLTD